MTTAKSSWHRTISNRFHGRTFEKSTAFSQMSKSTVIMYHHYPAFDSSDWLPKNRLHNPGSRRTHAHAHMTLCHLIQANDIGTTSIRHSISPNDFRKIDSARRWWWSQDIVPPVSGNRFHQRTYDLWIIESIITHVKEHNDNVPPVSGTRFLGMTSEKSTARAPWLQELIWLQELMLMTLCRQIRANDIGTTPIRHSISTNDFRKIDSAWLDDDWMTTTNIRHSISQNDFRKIDCIILEVEELMLMTLCRQIERMILVPPLSGIRFHRMTSEKSTALDAWLDDDEQLKTLYHQYPAIDFTEGLMKIRERSHRCQRA